ncbi:PP2C family protein-serine/threonine phosphatase [Sinorhizobium meliloti]|uniref:PP2C family protein-serine/threonine phosphatase n=1 Tax=Rhizobium meliloti TaxID=382 RepID=UPI000FD72F17|nr:protein phosphatase 2C domain-containing protein [Sinorhizobium meliloti]RVH00098.1 serine/threonine-protein phosphatase [Sinorhizobium meliloti]
MKFSAATISEAGPRSSNEDTADCWGSSESVLTVVVADGLGGMGGGAHASQLAVATLRRALEPIAPELADLRTAAAQAHDEIVAVQRANPSFARMATTLTAGAFRDGRLIGVHCGDSRAAIARNDGIKKLTSDHSEGERLFRAGKLSKDELLDYPRKHILDSALGIRGEPQIDLFEFPLQPGDKVFFTTDGVHGKIPLREMRQIAQRHDGPQAFVKEVAMLVEARVPEDNFTIAAVFVL